MNNLSTLTMLACTFAIVATSCQKEEAAAFVDSTPLGNTLVISATGADTRSGIDDLDFVWKSGDELKVKTNNETLTMTLNSDYANRSSGEFEGTITSTLEGYAYAVYHSNMSQVTFLDNSVDFTLPTTQIQKNGYDTQGDNYYYSTSLGEYTYMYGKSASELSAGDNSINVNMQHVMTIIDFELSNLPLDKELHYLTLSTDYALCATATVDIDKSSIEFSNSTINEVSVKLQTSNDAGFVTSDTDSDMTIRVALLPHQIPSDATWMIKISVSDIGSDVVDGEFSLNKSFAQSVDLEAGVRNKAVIDYEEMSIVDSTPGVNDYIDADGINHGEGIEINGLIWAPVNCGYDAINNKYGKLYQWGRIYGGGWSNSANTSVNGNDTSSTTQTKLYASTSAVVKVDAATANSSENSAIYYNTSGSSIGWQSDASASAWAKEYDPCPEGWRVPAYTADEMRIFEGAVATSSYVDKIYTTATLGVLYTDSDSGNQIFLPAAGYRNYGSTFSDSGVRSSAWYWTSQSNSDAERGVYLKFINAGEQVTTGWGQNTSKGAAMPVRCVKEVVE